MLRGQPGQHHSHSQHHSGVDHHIVAVRLKRRGLIDQRHVPRRRQQQPGGKQAIAAQTAAAPPQHHRRGSHNHGPQPEPAELGRQQLHHRADAPAPLRQRGQVKDARKCLFSAGAGEDMGLHRGEGRIRRSQRGKLGDHIAARRLEPPRSQQPDAEQPTDEKAEHQKEILRQRPGHCDRKQTRPDRTRRLLPRLQRLPQNHMAVQKHDALQHHQAVHPGEHRHALHADAEQPAGRRRPRGPEPPDQPLRRAVQHRRARQDADKVRQQPHPRQTQLREQRFRRIDQAIVERRVDIDLLVVPRDGIVKRAARRQDRAVKAAVVPAVHIAVLQCVEPTGIVCQLIGVQLVHMVALLVRRVVEHQRQPHGQQRRHRQHALGFCVFHDSRFPYLPDRRGAFYMRPRTSRRRKPPGRIWNPPLRECAPVRLHTCIPKRPASKGRPFVCFTPVRFLPCHAQNATAHRW